MSAIESPIMVVNEVAAYLRVHQTTIFRMLKRGELPAFKVGSDWRFERAAIEAWVRGRRAAAAK